jgi:hypothetical protein
MVLELGGVMSMCSVLAWSVLATVCPIFVELPVGENVTSLTDFMFNIYHWF